MTTARHLTWENFDRDILRRAVPAIHPISGTPAVQLELRTNPTRIGLTLPAPANTSVAPSSYREIEIGVQQTQDGTKLAVYTANAQLFRPFFSVLLEIADAVQIEGRAPLAAVLISIDRFARVIRRERDLSIDHIIGLWGELFVLEPLLRSKGPSAINMWHGWQLDRHDFRLNGAEFEVKTTTSAEPEHMINGAHQLAPCAGFRLYLISLQIIRSDRGMSLAERVARVQKLVEVDLAAFTAFTSALDDLHVAGSHSDEISEKFALRRSPWLVPVDEKLPRLTMEVLGTAIHSDALARLGDLHYQLNVSGLGLAQDSEPFRAVLPWMIDP